MSSLPRQLEYHRYRAPREDHAAMIDPPWGEIDGLVAQNVQSRARYDYDFGGRSFADLSHDARRELLRLAVRWTSAYRDPGPLASASPDIMFLAGHQPRLFHPGVWLKNFALSELAARHGAAAVNLIVDSDTVKSAALRVPGGTASAPSTEMVPLDRTEPSLPYEDRRIEDREVFTDFGRRAAQRIEPLVPDPMVRDFWPTVLARAAETDNLGICLAQARHQWEARWGCRTLEVPQSWVCSAPSFCWFAAHLLSQLARFRQIHNEALDEYRRVHHLRSPAQPIPDLAEEDGWLEAPFWVWTPAEPRRRPLWALHRNGAVELSDRQGLRAELPGDPARAAARLLELGQDGVRIRSRALITTLWARLVLGDLFLHGIGGAKYDQVTDLVIERFFGLAPPGFVVISATLLLPIERHRVSADDGRAIAHQLRELTYHPEKFVDSTAQRVDGQDADPTPLIAAKTRLIQTAPTPETARTRCRAIREVNERLQPWVAQRRRQLQERQAAVATALRAETVLGWREYGFCLYPEQTLQEFFVGLLPRSARM